MLVEWVPGPPKKKHDLLHVDLLSGSGRVSGSGDLQENLSEKTVKPPCSEAAEAINQIHFHLWSSKHLYINLINVNRTNLNLSVLIFLIF